MCALVRECARLFSVFRRGVALRLSRAALGRGGCVCCLLSSMGEVGEGALEVAVCRLARGPLLVKLYPQRPVWRE